MTVPAWQIYDGSRRTDPDRIRRWLADPPPWRKLDDATNIDERVVSRELPAALRRRGETYVTSGDDELLRVNMALMLRRPLLVTGAPGLGKTSLAYSIACCLGLGPPLRWEISSHSTLKDGLYSYDAVGHLQAAQHGGAEIESFITLGPLGTALLSSTPPRLLLVDELDKASYDLPHDLLHVFEEGTFPIPELKRAAGARRVYPYDCTGADDRVTVRDGQVRTRHHPVVVITSNGEREFPEAFLRRCVQLELKRPDNATLARIVMNQLGKAEADDVGAALGALQGENTDVLLQTLFLSRSTGEMPAAFVTALQRAKGTPIDGG